MKEHEHKHEIYIQLQACGQSPKLNRQINTGHVRPTTKSYTKCRVPPEYNLVTGMSRRNVECTQRMKNARVLNGRSCPAEQFA